MKALVKNTLKIIGLSIVVLLVVLVVFLATLDANQYKENIATAVHDATGRELIIHGDLSLTFFGSAPTIHVHDVTLSNAKWAEAPNMASLKELKLDVALFPLLIGELRVRGLTLVEPKIFLETDKQAHNNWQLGVNTETEQDPENTETDNEESQSSRPPFLLKVTKLSIEDAAVSYHNAITDKSMQLVLHEFLLEKRSATELGIRVDALYQNTPIKVEGTSGRVVMWQKDNNIPVDISFDVGNASLALKGQIDHPMTHKEVKMLVEAKVEKLAELSAVAGTTLPDLPPMSLRAEIHRTQDVVTVDALSATLGQSDLTGNVSANLSGEKPDIKVDLTSKLLDLVPIITLEQQTSDETLPAVQVSEETVTQSQQETAEVGTASEASPFAALHQLNAAVNVNVDRIQIPDFEVKDFVLASTLHNGRLSISQLTMKAAQGELASNIVLDNQQNDLVSLTTSLNVKGMNLSRLPVDVVKQQVSGAKTDVSVDLTSTGASLDELMTGAKGHLTVQLGNTSIKAAKWSKKPELLSFQQLGLDANVASLKGGLVTINQLRLLSPKLQLQTNKKGTGNWVFSDAATHSSPSKPASKKEPETSKPFTVQLGKLSIQKAGISFTDGQTKQTQKAYVNKLNVAKLNDKLLKVDALAYYRKTPISVSGNVGLIATALADKTYPVDLSVAANNSAKVRVKGTIAKPLSSQNVTVRLTGAVKQLPKLSALAEQDLPEMSPLNISASIKRTNKLVSVNHLAVKLGTSDLTGNITADLARKTPFIKATLNAQKFDTADLPQTKESDEKLPVEEKEAKPSRLFPKDPLVLDALNSVNADIQLSANHIQSNNLVVKDTHIGIKLKNGLLYVKPLASNIANGQLVGSIMLSSDSGVAELNTDMTIKGLEVTQFGDLKDKIKGGVTDVTLKLAGRGKSVSGIMGSANGKLLVTVDHITTDSYSGGLGLFTGGIFTAINPAADQQKDLDVKCSVIHFKIKDGIATADNGIAFDAKRMNIMGAGTIDLKTEKLSIDISPQAKEGSGISLGGLASMVSIGGTLMEPSPTVNMQAALETGLKTQAAIMTGGLSLIAQGLVNRTMADASPCDVALGTKKLEITEQQSSQQKE